MSTAYSREDRSAVETGEAPAPRGWQAWAASPAVRKLSLAAASLLIGFSTWQVLSTYVFNPFLIPPPLDVFRTAIPMLASGEILSDVSISMVRVLVGFTTGSLAGVIMGVLLGRVRLLHDLLDPIMELLRYLVADVERELITPCLWSGAADDSCTGIDGKTCRKTFYSKL